MGRCVPRCWSESEAGSQAAISTPRARWNYSSTSTSTSTYTPASQHHATSESRSPPESTHARRHGGAGRPSDPDSLLRLRVNAYLGSSSARTPTLSHLARRCAPYTSLLRNGVRASDSDHSTTIQRRVIGTLAGVMSYECLPNQSPKRLLIQQPPSGNARRSPQLLPMPCHVIYPHRGRTRPMACRPEAEWRGAR